MKVILSRKGFDSANGGIVSPIFDDGTMLSFLIPSKYHDKDNIKYEDLVCNGVTLSKILADLGYKDDECCHLDPDLEISRRKIPVKGWEPAFGQINQSASYLQHQGIDKGDLCLFFGNFRHVELIDGKYRYVRRNKNTTDPYYGKQIQAIWGYLQVEDIITDPEEQKRFKWHPHSCEKRLYEEKNNLIITASEHLSFAPEMSGAGILSYDPKRVLTMPGKSKAKENHYNYEKGIIIFAISPYGSNRLPCCKIQTSDGCT